jgi:two-component system response regulator DevR
MIRLSDGNGLIGRATSGRARELAEAARLISASEHDLAAVLDALAEQARRLLAADDDPLAALGSQERRVLPLLAEGKTNREIAAALYVSEHTAKSYVSDILHKLGVSRRSQAAAVATRLERRQEA